MFDSQIKQSHNALQYIRFQGFRWWMVNIIKDVEVKNAGVIKIFV